jgi:hypothetical protein
VSPATLNALGEGLGFLSAAALAWQAFRLVRHQKVTHDLRADAKQAVSDKAKELAEKGADVFEQTVSRWDERDQRLVVIGLIGLAGSFLLKLVALWLE